MKLTDLITKYLINYHNPQEVSSFLTYQRIAQVEIPNEIISFIDKFNQNSLITSEEFQLFNQALAKIGVYEQKVLLHLLFTLASEIYKQHEAEIKEEVNNIESCVKQSIPLPKNESNDQKYYGLVNAYRLLLENSPHLSNYYPGIVEGVNEDLLDIPFALNALRLVGKLSKSQNLEGLDLSKPFYPIKLKKITSSKTPLQKGMIDSDDYFPFKRISKMAKGDGNTTFKASNGSKNLYVRGQYYSPQAVFASKIATLISRDHFSSERILNNRLVASREHKSYVISPVDDSIYEVRKELMEQKNFVFPGTGLIDEVTNFIRERDPNIENYGFSSLDLRSKSCHLSKIDFGCCDFDEQLIKRYYERDILTEALYFREQVAAVKKNEAYIKEKLYARLKLSMMPDQLVRELANRSYLPEDVKDKDLAIQEVIHRKQLALELFLRHPEAVNWLKENPAIVNECYNEMVIYIKSHFADQDQIELQSDALKESAQSILDYCQYPLESVTLDALQVKEKNTISEEVSLSKSDSQRNRYNFFEKPNLSEKPDLSSAETKKLPDPP